MSNGASTSPDEVLAFWFGTSDEPPLAKAEQWWKKDPAFDSAVRDRFGAAFERAVRGELEDWRGSPRGRLALVVILDQFSRNMFRGDARSFAQDEQARTTAKRAIEAGDLHALPPIRAGFLLLPWMHAEDIALQRRCEEGFRTLRDLVPASDPVRDALDSSLRFAGLHAAIIERFGRFPHRNAVLGRASTPEEAEFLKQPNSAF